MQQFWNMINSCGFIDLGFNGPEFTWCNKREPQVRVWEGLDRALANAEWIRLYEDFEAQHLPMVGFDHGPFLLGTAPNIRADKSFRYRTMSLRHESFVDRVKNLWSEQNNGFPLNKLCQKIQSCKGLRNWNRTVLGHIGTELNKTCSLIASLQDSQLTSQEEEQLQEALSKYEELLKR